MKKTISILIYVLFILTILYPAGAIITACLGYRFELICVSAFAVIIAAISIYVVHFATSLKEDLDYKAIRILAAIITPFSLVNTVFYILKCPNIFVISCVVLASGCCCFLTIKYGKPLALKIISLVLSALMILPIGFFCFIALIFGSIGQNTVVKTVESPNGKYYAQVIDSDQGALGGDTFIDVYEKSVFNGILFKIEKKPKRVYFGDWGEFQKMHIYWKDNQHLVINSVEYEIE